MVALSPSVTGRFRIVKTRADGTVTYDATSRNVVLESGLKNAFNKIFSSTSTNDKNLELLFFANFNWLFMGSGTTEPAITDTGLESRSQSLPGKHARGGDGYYSTYYIYGYTNWSEMPVVAVADQDNHLYWSEVTMEFRYGEGEAEGVWTELGLADDSNYTNPFTRALIRDEDGNPISLTVLSDEFLTVFYTIRYQDGMGEPQQGSFLLNGVTHGFTVRQNPGDASNGWLSSDGYYRSSNGSTSEKAGIWRSILPFKWPKLYKDIAAGYYDLYGKDDDENISITSSYDAPTDTLSLQVVMDPSNSDKPVARMWDDKALYILEFDAGLTKLSDHRMTLDIDIAFQFQLPPVSGLQAVPSTSGLDFSWDAYPDATEYVLVLRQAGTVIEEQTVTAPTATASFTGLTASTEYHLDIQPKTSGRDGARSIQAATTGAA